MTHFTRVARSVAAIGIVLATFSSPAFAGGTYNCRNDKRVDVPIQFVIDVQSAGRVHVSAYGGSDRSTVLYPTGWTLSDAAGKQIDNFPKAPIVWTSSNMLKEANVEGLAAGA